MTGDRLTPRPDTLRVTVKRGWCDTHKKYQAKAPPRTLCYDCWRMWVVQREWELDTPY